MIDFSNSKFSPKAIDFIQNSTARLNIAHGSVRSSKTVNCTVRWLDIMLTGPPGDLLMSGKTVATLQRNVMNDLFDLVGSKHYHWINKQQGELAMLGRRIHVVGANNEDSESRIRGSTIAAAYCDEITLYPRSFVDMLITRMSVKGAVALMNCNPDAPNHWFKKDYIDNPKITDKKVWHFTLDDNPNLDPAYRRSLEESFSGVFRDRFIKGLWVIAEGIIYDKFANNPTKYIVPRDSISMDDIGFCSIGLDFGGNGAGHAFNCTGFKYDFSHIYTLFDYWDNSDMDAYQLSEAFVAFIRQCEAHGCYITEIRADTANTIMIRTIRNALLKAGIGIPILDAVKGKIWNRIQFYNLLFNRQAYTIAEECTHTIASFQEASWHPRVPNTRLDDFTSNIDNLDAQEYSTEPWQSRINDVLMVLVA